MPSTVPCPETTPQPFDRLGRPQSAERDDLRTADGLRHALGRMAVEGGWSGPLGERLLQMLSEHCVRLAPLVERRSGQPPDPHRAADLTSRAWELLATRPERIVGASNPGGYLTRCLVTAGVNAAIADWLLVRDIAIQGGGVPATISPQRVGEHLYVLDHANDKHANSDVDSSGPWWDVALHGLHGDLVEAGAPAGVTAEAIDRVVDIVASNRNGHREAAAKTDRVLAHLGLSAAQSTALVALIAGTRRGGVEESLWARRRHERTCSEPAISDAVRARIEVYISGFTKERECPPKTAKPASTGGPTIGTHRSHGPVKRAQAATAGMTAVPVLIS